MGHIGQYRLAAGVPVLNLADPAKNAKAILGLYEKAVKGGACVLVTPELGLTGCSCGDLFEQEGLLTAARQALHALVKATKGRRTALVVGLPLRVKTRLYDVAAVLQEGTVVGLTVKSHLPDYREHHEKRLFHLPSDTLPATCLLEGREYPLTAASVYHAAPDFSFGIELGEDLRVVEPPSGRMALAGAQAILNLAAEPECTGSAAARRSLVVSQSARIHGAYVLASAGMYESTADMVFSGHALIAFDGQLLAESPRLSRKDELLFADFVPRWADHQRIAWSAFNDRTPQTAQTWALPQAVPPAPDLTGLPIARLPFVPTEPAERAAHCAEALAIQAAALTRRVESTHARRLVIGLSGGLDSTLALLAGAKCCDLLGRPRSFVLGVTMPGMGTTGRTKGNAIHLAEALGAELREIDIRPSVRRHFQDIGHDPKQLDVVYENAQARERTQILMDLSNQEGGLLVGTGDLSEIALGWCTYNGDHMSMYGVNCGVPKTLIRAIVLNEAERAKEPVASLLKDVVDTPVSPELLPGAQKTESILGAYDLHDFFLYHFLKHGESARNLLLLANHAFAGQYTDEQISRALQTFLHRFVTQQFKRNAS
ncbi:MAG: NAD(+) synthase, partial [Victivallales bacterium]|nr:NAD(+) synthase [Victivallales bacterium]